MDFISISFKAIISILINTNFIQKRKEIKLSSKYNIISCKTKKINACTNNVKLTKINYITINFFIIIILIYIIKGFPHLLLSSDSYITFKIKPKDKIKLFFPIDNKKECSQLTFPDLIELNGTNYTNISFNYTIEAISGQMQEVKLIWKDNNKPTSTGCLFLGCSEITEIDLSNFDSSEVIRMSRMFYQCSFLTSLDLSNLNTSKVTHINALFYSCTSLKYINLSNFDTSKIKSMSSLFSYCLSLVSLDISNFNTSEVKSMNFMFHHCQSLKTLDLSNFVTSNVESMEHMFDFCESLESLSLSNFDTSQVTNMVSMFGTCTNLNTLDISNFNTANVVELYGIFNSCGKLTSLNLSKFDTSKVTNMNKMFNNCGSLKFLDTSNFNAENVTLMYNMFSNCEKLESLNLSNFNTMKVLNMSYLFSNCKSLSNLDISNFNTINVKDMKYMFSNCTNLTSLNLFHFNTSKVTNMERMFYNCISLNSLNISNFDTSKVENMNSMFSKCHSLKSLDITNFNTIKVTRMGGMFAHCHSINSLDLTGFNTSNVKIMDNMFTNCLNLISLNLSNFNTDKVNTLQKMFYNCSNLEYLNLKIAKLNDNSDISDIFSLSNNNLVICSQYEKWSNILSNKYLTINCRNMKFNKTSLKCYKKLINGANINNICESCGLNYSNQIIKESNDINCFKTCPNYHFFDIYTNEMLCSQNCFGIYNKLIKEKNECIDDCKKDDIFKYELENQYYNNICLNKTILVIGQIYQLISKINSTKLENGKDEDIEEENILISLTTTKNQKNNENINKTTINLGDCEYKLKWYYNISINDSLYIIKLDIKEEGMKIPKIEYEVYYPLNRSNELTKLNLSICKDIKIEIAIPVIINETLDKYNISSKYYNDICTAATSNKGTDITLSDRKNEFINNNMTLCEENCELIDYNYTNKKAKCSCDIKINITNIDKVKFDKDLFKKSFIDINNMMNLNVMKCYKNVFKLVNLKNNFGFFINLGVVFLFCIMLIIFFVKSWNQLYLDIKEIILVKSNISFNYNINNKNTPIRIVKKKGKKRKKSKKLLKKNISNNSNFNNILSEKTIEFKNKTNDLILSNDIKNKNILEYKDFEFNSLNFEKAINEDKRNLFQYYISSIKINNLLLFSFLPIKDYNVMIIKNFLFFFFFTLNLTVNALFFNDNTMHKIYIDEGKYNLIYQIPQILYSSIISWIISTLIKYLSLSQDNIMDLKHSLANILDIKYKKFLLNLKIKFALFFILTFLLLMFFWYCMSCFCGIYQNTQEHLLKDSILSFSLSLLDPLWQSLLFGLFNYLNKLYI